MDDCLDDVDGDEDDEAAAGAHGERRPEEVVCLHVVTDGEGAGGALQHLGVQDRAGEGDGGHDDLDADDADDGVFGCHPRFVGEMPIEGQEPSDIMYI